MNSYGKSDGALATKLEPSLWQLERKFYLFISLTFLIRLDIVKHLAVVKYCLSTRCRGLTTRLQTRPNGLVCNLAVNPLHLVDKHYIYSAPKTSAQSSIYKVSKHSKP